MTLDLTIRQKLVRVLSSAAVCGLSVSFIVGEAVDHKAREISHWATDARLAPSAYMPLRPIAKTLQVFSPEMLQASLTSVNLNETIAPTVPAAPTFQDSLRTILAAPTEKLSETEKASRPRPLIYKDKGADTVLSAKLKPEPELDTKDVERVLLSIHDATSQLSPKTPSKSTAVAAGTIIVKALPDDGSLVSTQAAVVHLPLSSAAKEEVSQNDVIIMSEAPEQVLATMVEEKEWIIRGKISPGFTILEPGHYEVGLFSKIDQDGIPVGFPVAQKILPAGISDFQIRVPSKIERGYLYGEYVVTQTGKRSWIAPPLNPWIRGDRQFADLVFKKEDTISTIASSLISTRDPSSDTWKIKGSVSTLFAQGVPQEDVVIKVRGRKESTRTDKAGIFFLEIPKVKGTVHLEFLKSGYHPALVAVPSDDEDQVVKVELASRGAIDAIATRLGVRQLSNKGVFLGRAAGAGGQSIKGLTLQMNAKTDGPFYFGEDGHPHREHKATTADGRFLFLNVEPGTGFVESTLNGEAIAPFLLSTVEGGEIVIKTLTPVSGSVKGRLFNPVSSAGKMLPVSGARIRIEGASDWSSSDSYGAFNLGPMKWMRGQKISLEFSAERFNNHRYVMTPDERRGAVNLYAFPAMYIGRLARSMDIELDQYSGIVLGKVSNLSVRIDALADHSVVNSAKDFYFDSKGKLRGSHTMTDPKFGTYVIFNVPKGRTLLQGNDSGGVLRYSEAVVSSPASISIVMD